MKWFDNIENFPAVMINKTRDFTIAKNRDNYFLNMEYGFRLATKKESNTLYTKNK